MRETVEFDARTPLQTRVQQVQTSREPETSTSPFRCFFTPSLMSSLGSQITHHGSSYSQNHGQRLVLQHCAASQGHKSTIKNRADQQLQMYATGTSHPWHKLFGLKCSRRPCTRAFVGASAYYLHAMSMCLSWVICLLPCCMFCATE